MTSDALDVHFRPSFLRAFGGGLLRPWTRLWFRYTVEGAVPAGPVLLVGNHSGIGIADVLCFVGAFADVLGPDRRAVGMMHDAFIRAPGIGRIARAFGAVRACPEAARLAIARGHDVVVFPGGGIDSCRPFTAAREVRFGAHRGYVRLALETGIPVVPIATVGSHGTYVLLPGGDRLARLLRLRRWSRDTTVPITLGTLATLATLLLCALGLAAWGWLAVVLACALVPTPVRITSRILPPIDVRGATAHLTDPRERIEAAHHLVHGMLQRAVAAR